MIESSPQAPTAEVLAYSTKVAPSYHVTCTDCGAIIARHEAYAFVSQRQAGEVVELLRRFVCQDRESCQARGPIMHQLAQIQAERDELKAALSSIMEIVSLPSHTTAGNPDASERVELISEIITAELIR